MEDVSAEHAAERDEHALLQQLQLRQLELEVRNKELLDAKAALRQLNAALQQTVAEQTAALSSSELLLAKQFDELEQVYRTAPVGLAYLDRDLRYVRVNDLLAAMNGKTAAEHIGRTPAEIIPDIATDVLALMRQVLHTGQPVLDVEVSGTTAAEPGTQRQWIAHHYPLKSDDGQIQGLSAVVVDVTDRKKAEASLAASEERFRLFMDNSPTIAWIKDDQDRYVYFSGAYERRFGVRLADWRGKTPADRWPPDVAAEFRKIDLTVLATGQPQQVMTSTPNPDGSSCSWLSTMFPFRDVSGRAYLGGIGLDISERLKAEEALRENTVTLRSFYESSPMMMGIAELDGDRAVVIDGNRAYAVFRSLRPKGLADRPAMELCDSGDFEQMWLNNCRRSLEGGKPVRFEYQCPRLDGKHWLSATVSFIGMGTNGNPRFCFVAEDNTDNKRLEKEKEEALVWLAMVEETERHRISRELHDQTSQQLATLSVQLKSLEAEHAGNQPLNERLRLLRKTVGDLQEHIRQIAWEMHAGECVKGDLQNALREFLQEWSEIVQVPVDCECRNLTCPPLPAPIEVTLFRVTQEALANVSKHARARRVSVLLECDASVVRLTVEDDGCGFDVDAVEKLPGAERRLGLLGMRERVSLVRGTLLIESAPGAGTTILVRIPLPTEAQRQ